MLILNVKKCQLKKGEITQACVKIPSDLLILKKEKKRKKRCATLSVACSAGLCIFGSSKRSVFSFQNALLSSWIMTR